jgi:hypothetical protein
MTTGHGTNEWWEDDQQESQESSKHAEDIEARKAWKYRMYDDEEASQGQK